MTVHYATARMVLADAVYTYDKDFDRLGIKRIEP